MKVVLALCVAVIALEAVTAFDLLDPTSEIHDIAKNIRGDVERFLGRRHKEFAVVSYRMQPALGGKHYFLKIRVGSSFIHVKVFKPRFGAVKFVSVRGGMKLWDPLHLFD